MSSAEQLFDIGNQVYFFNGKSFEFAIIEEALGNEVYKMKTRSGEVVAAVFMGPFFTNRSWMRPSMFEVIP